MKIVVTGAAGFVGSSICKALASDHEVIGIDSFDETLYPAQQKRNRASELSHFSGFTLVSEAIQTLSAPSVIFGGADFVIHCAAIPGLRPSWEHPEMYIEQNLGATLRLAESVAQASDNTKIIHLSTSSVYGKNARGSEAMEVKPVSPYGITKLAAERELDFFATKMGLDVMILRLFSVYGPGQRPDMAFFRLIEAALNDSPFTVFGDGTQSRSNTYIGDVVTFIRRIVEGETNFIAGVFNIGGGEVASLNRAISIVQSLTGSEVRLMSSDPVLGDQVHTEADVGKARDMLGFSAPTGLELGLAGQVSWQMALG